MPKNDFLDALSSKKNIALLLSSGGMTAAAFHCGIVRALEEIGITFAKGIKSENQEFKDTDVRHYIGLSAGSFIATELVFFDIKDIGNSVFDPSNSNLPEFTEKDLLVKNYYSLKRKDLAFIAKMYFKYPNKYKYIKDLIDFYLNDGAYSTDGIKNYFEKVFKKNNLPNDFKELKPRLSIVATCYNEPSTIVFCREDFELDDTKYISSIPISEAVACSSAMPEYYKKRLLKINEKEVVVWDGAIKKIMPTHIARDLDKDVDLVISSHIVTPFVNKNSCLEELTYNLIKEVYNGKKFEDLDKEKYFSSMNKLEADLKQAISISQYDKLHRGKTYHEIKLKAMETLHGFFKEEIEKTKSKKTKKYLKNLHEKLTEEIESNLDLNPNLSYLTISPDLSDNYLFLTSSSLKIDKKVARNVEKKGYDAAMKAIKEFKNTSLC